MNKKLDAEITRHYDKARGVALDAIVEKARAILKARPHLTEFCMAMGSATFSHRDGRNLALDEYAYMAPVCDLIDEWDGLLKLTGEPMRFTADSEITRDW